MNPITARELDEELRAEMPPRVPEEILCCRSQATDRAPSKSGWNLSTMMSDLALFPRDKKLEAARESRKLKR